MSDSEDDFMSDKFLVDIPTTSTSTYTQKRSAQHLKSLRAGQAKNLPSTKELEEQRRREGLNTSLFAQHASASRSVGSGLRRTQQDDEEDEEDDDPPKAGPSGRGPAAAMGMMMKMGWKMGEGLGRQRSPSPDTSSKRARQDGTDEGKSGVGKSNGQSRGRAEPIRISLWAGRKGLTARSPSPPPLPSKNNPDVLDGRKMERLGRETDDFRERQRRDYKDKEVERKEFKARELLAGFDQEKGVKYHPLHALPSDPVATLPRPLLRLIYPAQVFSPSPDRSRCPSPVVSYEKEKNLSAAEKMREQIRRDMLSELGDEEDFGALKDPGPLGSTENGVGVKGAKAKEEEDDGTDWEGFVSGTKKVLAMDPASHLEFLVSQLRHEHLYCFWCAYKYSSYEEMEALGGCPGEEEDDH